MGIYPVTQQEYENVMGETPNMFKKSSHPMIFVNWFDATGFCEELTKQSSEYSYRLPTSIEWEYACRAGTNSAYYWGNDMDSSYCWCNKEPKEGPAEVGGRHPNPWGLYDMSGNVLEWCTSIDNGKEEFSVIRGGGWNDEPIICRSRVLLRSRSKIPSLQPWFSGSSRSEKLTLTLAIRDLTTHKTMIKIL